RPDQGQRRKVFVDARTSLDLVYAFAANIKCTIKEWRPGTGASKFGAKNGGLEFEGQCKAIRRLPMVERLEDFQRPTYKRTGFCLPRIGVLSSLGQQNGQQVKRFR